MSPIRRFGILLFVASIAAGCAASRSIAEDQCYPDRFHDDRVAIRGVVTNSCSLPFARAGVPRP